MQAEYVILLGGNLVNSQSFFQNNINQRYVRN